MENDTENDARKKFEALPADKQAKATGDVYCIQCQKSFSLETYDVAEFRGTLMISGSCPTCGSPLTKPVSSVAGE